MKFKEKLLDMKADITKVFGYARVERYALPDGSVKTREQPNDIPRYHLLEKIQQANRRLRSGQ